MMNSAMDYQSVQQTGQNINQKLSDESSDDDDQLNTEQIDYNHQILEAYQAFQNRDLNNAIQYYTNALASLEKTQDFDRIALVKANLAVIYFHNCEYRRAAVLLEEALNTLKSINKQNDQRKALFIKILANLCIVYIVLNKYEDSKEANEGAIEIIRTSKDTIKKELLEELVYLYFRFTSFENMGDGYFENVESKYDGSTLACFYSSMALNRQLCQDDQNAYRYHQKALEIWTQLKEPGFIVLTLRHLLYLNQQLQIPYNKTVEEYKELMQEHLQSKDFNGVKPETLFKDFEKKINCAKEITKSLQQIEIDLQKSLLKDTKKDAGFNLTGSQSKNEINQIEFVNENGEPMWKQALKLRLGNSIRYSKSLLSNPKVDQEQKKSLQKGIDQMRKTQQMLNYEKHPLIEKQLINMPYTKEAVNNLKASINKIRKFFLMLMYSEPLEKIKQTQANKLPYLSQYQQNQYQQTPYQQRSQQQPFNSQYSQVISQQQVQQSQLQSQKQLLAQQYFQLYDQKHIQLIKTAYTKVMVGDYLLKCNKNTNGRSQKFFQLATDNTLRWTANEKNISNPNKVQYYHVREIRGVVYGKVTETMRKSYNKRLEQWLCFSLVLKTRSLDFYCEDDQISAWVIALSEEVKKNNNKAYVLSAGKFLWLKVKYQLFHYFLEPIKQKNKFFKWSFSKAIILYNQNGLKLPPKPIY